MVSLANQTQIEEPSSGIQQPASLDLPESKQRAMDDTEVIDTKKQRPGKRSSSQKKTKLPLEVVDGDERIAQNSSEESESQLLIDATTQYKTNISSSLSEQNSPQEQDLSKLPPLEGFEWRDLLFPEIDVVDLHVQTSSGKEIKLMTYRWAPKNERKGVIFLMHGYGSCAPHMAAIAKHHAEQDFEIFGMDMRGHGDSEGERGIFEGADQVYADYWAMIFETCKKFKINQQKTPIFLFARSLGGLIATNMANTTIGKSMFAGVVLLTPYYRLFTEKLYQAYKYLVPLTWVKPNHIFKCEYQEMDPDYAKEYDVIFSDKRYLDFFTATTARLWVEEQEKARESVSLAPQPMCFVLGEAENVVRNDYIEEFYGLSQNTMNEIHTIKGADHTDICFNKSYASQLIRTSVNFCQKIIEAKSNQ